MPAKSGSKANQVSKQDTIVRLLRSNKGATVAQLQKATGWQAHSIRGFMSGIVKKRLGLALKSDVGKNGERRYAISAN